MNIISKKVNSMILVGLIATTMPVCATHSQKQTKKITSVWYKKRSVHVAGAAVGIMGVMYMLATHMDKIVPVAFFAALFSKISKRTPVASKTETVIQNNPVTEQNPVVTQQQENISVPVEIPHVQVDTAEKQSAPTGVFNQIASYFMSWKPSLPQITRDELDIMVSPY